MRQLRVLVLDEGFISGAVTATSLRDAGCDVEVIAATGGRGRCRRSAVSWSLAPRVGDPRLVATLDRAVARGSFDVIYPVTEPLQQLIWDERPTWESRVFPRVDDADRALRRDKRLMSARLARAGVSVPREVPADDLSAAIAALGLPIVVKGSAGRGGQATHICATLQESSQATESIRAAGSSPFAQKYVAGATWLAGGFFVDGEPIRFFAGRKSVQYPSRIGPAAEIISDDHPAFVAMALNVFRLARVTGIASLDAIRDSSGEFFFLELNPRPWGSIQAAADAGVDVFGPLVAHWQSLPASPDPRFRAGQRTAVFPLYLLSSEFRRGGHFARSLRADFGRAVAFAIHQPREALHHLHRLMRVGINWSQPVFHK